MSAARGGTGEALVLRHVPWEGLGAFAGHLDERGMPWRYVDLFAGESVPDLRGARAVFVMGGPMDADEADRYPFLEAETRALRAAAEAGTPILGVCLGCQLLAVALGAAVEPGAGKEIGWGPLHRETADDPILGHFRPEETVLHWHGDVFGLPTGAVPLASSPPTRHQAFRWGDSAWGLLFHVEADPRLVREWMREPTMRSEAAELAADLPEKIEAEAPKREERLSRLQTAVLDALLGPDEERDDARREKP